MNTVSDSSNSGGRWRASSRSAVTLLLKPPRTSVVPPSVLDHRYRPPILSAAKNRSRRGRASQRLPSDSGGRLKEGISRALPNDSGDGTTSSATGFPGIIPPLSKSGPILPNHSVSTEDHGNYDDIHTQGSSQPIVPEIQFPENTHALNQRNPPALQHNIPSTGHSLSSPGVIMDPRFSTIEEQALYPRTIKDLNPNALKFLSATLDRRFRLENVSYIEYAQWERRHSTIVENLRLKISYNAFKSVLIIECTSCVHDAFATFFINQGARQLGRIIEDDGLGLFFTGPQLVEGFTSSEEERGIARSRKFPDASITVLGKSLPSIIVEVGFSEELHDLIEDAKLYLTKTRGEVETVIILEVVERDPAKTPGNEYRDGDGNVINYTEAKKRTFKVPPGFDEKKLLADKDNIKKLKEYYLQEDIAKRLIPRLVGTINCRLHVYRAWKGEQQTSHPGPVASASAVGGGGEIATNDIEGIECTFTSEFMVDSEFVTTLPPEKHTLIFTIRELMGNHPLSENLLHCAEESLRWPLKTFSDLLLGQTMKNMQQERAQKRAREVVKILEMEAQKRRKSDEQAERNRVRQEGLLQGTKGSRKHRAKRDFTDSDLGPGDDNVETFAQTKRRRARREAEREAGESEGDEEEEKPRRRSTRLQDDRGFGKRRK